MIRSLVPLLALCLVPVALAGGGGHEKIDGADALGPSANLVMTFSDVGSFHYFCKPHEGMLGKVIVSDDADAQNGSANVTIDTYAFKPGELKVKPGTSITWTNLDEVWHTVTFKTIPPAEEAAPPTIDAAATQAANEAAGESEVSGSGSEPRAVPAMPIVAALALAFALALSLRKREA